MLIDRYCIPAEKDEFFSHAQRSSIVDFVLRRTRYAEEAELDKKYSYGKWLGHACTGDWHVSIAIFSLLLVNGE